MYPILQDIVEREDGREFVSPPIQQLSAEKLIRYGIFLMDYGLVCCGLFGVGHDCSVGRSQLDLAGLL